MGRGRGQVQRNSFVKGLITEASPLTFPENASIAEENFDLYRDGSRSRRLGIDFEESYVANEDITATDITTNTLKTYDWHNAGTDENKNFTVVQIGATLYFYDLGLSDAVSANKRNYSLDLVDFVLPKLDDNPAGGNWTASEIAVASTDVAVIRGNLVITNVRCFPITVVYDDKTDTFIANYSSVQTRDFIGIDDGYQATTRPNVSELGVATPSGVVTTNAKAQAHLYNLHNQGWTIDQLQKCTSLAGGTVTADALNEAHGLPSDTYNGNTLTGNLGWASNADIPHLGNATTSSGTVTNVGKFFPYQLYKAPRSSYPAPKGHNIVSALDTIKAYNTYKYKPNVTSSTNYQKVNLIGMHEADITSATYTTKVGNVLYFTVVAVYPEISKDETYPVVLRGLKATLNYSDGVDREYELTDEHFHFNEVEIYPTEAPTYATGSVTFTFKVVCDIANHESHVAHSANAWLTFDVSNATVSSYLDTEHVELDRAKTNLGFTTSTSFAGRAWYAGLNKGDFQNYIFYSQIVKDASDVSKCYSAGDPTTEFNNDIVDTDGGFIQIPEADKIVKLVAVSQSVFAFASNGVWEITGGESNFSATSNAVYKISTVGVSSVDSIVVVEDAIFFIAIGGIYRMGKGEVSGRYELQNISEETIQTEILNLSAVAKLHVKSAYDESTRRIYWLVNDDSNYSDDGGVENINKYKTIYILETVLGSFFKYTIADDRDNTLPFIADIIQLPTVSKLIDNDDVWSNGEIVWHDTDGDTIYDADETVVSSALVTRDTNIKTKFFVVSNNGVGTAFATFATLKNTSFLDWFEHDNVGTDYESFLVTGYELAEDMTKNKQASYVMMYFKRTETFIADGVADNPSSCFLTGLWDFASYNTSAIDDINVTDELGNVGVKQNWLTSTKQQAYRIPRWSAADDGAYRYGQDVITTKNKIRGRGKSLSLDIRSESGKDLYIYGWGIPITRSGRV